MEDIIEVKYIIDTTNYQEDKFLLIQPGLKTKEVGPGLVECYIEDHASYLYVTDSAKKALRFNGYGNVQQKIWQGDAS